MAIEIVDFPINSMVIFHCYVSLPEGIPSGWSSLTGKKFSQVADTGGPRCASSTPQARLRAKDGSTKDLDMEVM